MKTIINFCLIFYISLHLSVSSEDEQEKSLNLNQLRAEIILTHDALWDLCFYHINELGPYEKGFRRSVCKYLWIPDLIKGFILNAHPDFINRIDSLLQVFYELKYEEHKIKLMNNGHSSEYNKENLDLHANFLKETFYFLYSQPEYVVRNSEGQDYEFRREFKAFCDEFNIDTYLIVEKPIHSTECSDGCFHTNILPYLFLREYHKKEYHYDHPPCLFSEIKSTVGYLYAEYLKEYPFIIDLKKEPSGRIFFAFTKKRVPFHIWLKDKIYNAAQTHLKNGEEKKQYIKKT
jgi:hypothetical protein